MHDILVLGAGYAGLATVTGLAGRMRGRGDVRITLVNATDRFTERLRLHQTGSGQPTAELAVPDLLAGSGVAFVRGWVTAVDAAAHRVRVDDRRDLRYDTLVWALGSVADTGAVPGADEHAYALDGRADAEALADRLAQPGSGGVVVIGGGLTGVEAAAEIAERHPGRTVLLVARDEPAATMTPRARARLRRALDRLGVEVRTGTEVAEVLPGAVVLADGTSIAAHAVVWTGGTRVSPLAGAAGLTVDERGRIVTDPVLRSVSHPDVYAVGDAAAIRQNYGVIHGTCQSGMPTGVHVAVAIARELAGRQPRPFRFGYFHAPVSLGRRDAVVQFTRPDDSPRRLYLSGRWAAWYKETVSSAPWPVFRRMLRVPALGAYWAHGGRYTR